MCPTELSDTGVGTPTSAHNSVSVAMSLGTSPSIWPLTEFAWTSSSTSGANLQFLLTSSSPFDPFAPPAQAPPSSIQGTNASIAAWRTTSANPGSALAWTTTANTPLELRYSIVGSGGTGAGATSSSPYTTIAEKWNPCVAQDAVGNTIVVWAEPETQLEDSPFDIKVQRFDPNGIAVGTSLIVNATRNLSQLSPSTSIDNSGRILIVWYGPGTSGCGGPASTRIFGQQLQLTMTGLPLVGAEFIADSATNAAVNVNPGDASPPLPNPTVTWAGNTAQPARFLVAWNTLVTPALSSPVNEVHGQYFSFSTGGPLAIFKEFRIPREQGWTGLAGRETRMLAASGQHTLTAAPDGSVIATWYRKNVANQPPRDTFGSFATILPSAFDAALCCTEVCCRGDTNGDHLVNGLDTQDFLEVLFGGGFLPAYPCSVVSYPCVYDINGDCKITDADRIAYICLFLGLPNCTPCTNTCITVESPQPGFAQSGGGGAVASEPANGPNASAHRDCNGNGVPDADELAAGTVNDCNLNGVPDECDLGFNPSITDANRNLIPDDCESATQAPAAAMPVIYHVGSGVPCPNGEVIMTLIEAWSAAIDWSSMPVWRQAYEIKQKLAEFGIAME